MLYPEDDALYPVRVCGIPALAGYGFEEDTVEVFDRRGRPAPWLQTKLDNSPFSETVDVLDQIYLAIQDARQAYWQRLTKKV